MTMSESTAPDLGFVHRFACGVAGAPALLLLHGTGGDENDLVPLAKAVAPGSCIVSPRGKVVENGMPRFFRRFAEGVFDLDDVGRQADDLAGFVAAAREHYEMPKPVALGFSNGANIAAALMLRHPDALAGAALVRAMPTIEPAGKPDLAGLPVLLLSGALDPIVPETEAGRLAEMLRKAGAAVRHETLPAGHNLTQADLDILTAWIAGLERPG
jgi:phospholipase/carboxylesterase